MCRKCGEPDRRGRAAVRRRRKQRLVEGAGAWSCGGNGTITACVWCGILLWRRRENDYLAVAGRRLPIVPIEEDRIEAGWYALVRVVAACGPCNRSRDVYRWPAGCQYGPELAA